MLYNEICPESFWSQFLHITILKTHVAENVSTTKTQTNETQIFYPAKL